MVVDVEAELMLFGVLSLLMGHWIVIVAKICVKSSVLSSRFFPCAVEEAELSSDDDFLVSMSESLNKTNYAFAKRLKVHDYCSEVMTPLIALFSPNFSPNSCS